MRQRVKRREGVVVAAQMNKTVVVQVERLVAAWRSTANGSSAARASWRMTKRAECREGDRVLIIESRPLSKNKRWRVSQVIAQAAR